MPHRYKPAHVLISWPSTVACLQCMPLICSYLSCSVVANQTGHTLSTSLTHHVQPDLCGVAHSRRYGHV
jgi:hypothetical protein